MNKKKESNHEENCEKFTEAINKKKEKKEIKDSEWTI